MIDESKQLDSLIVDVEDSTTLLKLYIGRLTKTPGRALFYPPLAEHGAEIASAIERLEASIPGRAELLRIAAVLTSLARFFNETNLATLDRILVVQEGIDLLEAQLDHMLQGHRDTSQEVLSGLERVEASAREIREHAGPGLGAPARAAALEQNFEEDPFDEFALSDDFLDELVGGFDAALEASMAEHVEEPSRAGAMPAFEPGLVEPGPVTLSPGEEEALKELFAQIAMSYVTPIRDFVTKLRIGPVTSGWVDLCMPAVQSMARASASMGYANLGEALDGFGTALREVPTGGRVIDGDRRARVLAAYQRMAEILPTAFPLVETNADAESEAIILNSLLKQIKGVGRMTISRLFSAGLVSLDAFCVADPLDLAAAAGLRPRLAERICERFLRYRDEAAGRETRDSLLDQLEGLVHDLRSAQFEFKKATLEEWYTHQPSRTKVKARRLRQQAMWKVNMSLAELGEVDLIRAIKDDIYDKRLDRLEAYLTRVPDEPAPGADE
jgi:hypothetical protein